MADFLEKAEIIKTKLHQLSILEARITVFKENLYVMEKASPKDDGLAVTVHGQGLRASYYMYLLTEDMMVNARSLVRDTINEEEEKAAVLRAEIEEMVRP